MFDREPRHRLRQALLAAIAVVAIMGAAARGDDAPAANDVRVTAILATATNAPLRVTGSDGMEHLEYDLVLTNVFAAPVTLSAVEVTGPDGQALLRLGGDALRAVTQPVFGGAPTREVPVSGAVAVVMDVVVPPGPAPARIGHRIAYDLAPDAPARAVIGSLVAEGPELDVDPRAALVLSPPLRGDGWLNGSGCCATSQHRIVRLAVDGSRFIKPETFAIDWVRLRDGRLFQGDGSRVEDWYGFGADVLSAADGTVVHVRDGMPEEVPNQPPAAVKATADYAGNSVIIEIGPGLYAAYAHLQPGSLRVAVGDRVKVGQVLGLLGNTGNSSAPHLHFGIQDRPDILTSNSLPFVFDRYEHEGAISEEDVETASTGSGESQVSLTGPASTEAATYPLYLGVTRFP